MGWYLESEFILTVSKNISLEKLKAKKFCENMTLGEVYKIEQQSHNTFLISCEDKYGTSERTVSHAHDIRKCLGSKFLSLKFEVADEVVDTIEFMPIGYREKLLKKLRTAPPNYLELESFQ